MRSVVSSPMLWIYVSRTDDLWHGKAVRGQSIIIHLQAGFGCPRFPPGKYAGQAGLLLSCEARTRHGRHTDACPDIHQTFVQCWTGVIRRRSNIAPTSGECRYQNGSGSTAGCVTLETYHPGSLWGWRAEPEMTLCMNNIIRIYHLVTSSPNT